MESFFKSSTGKSQSGSLQARVMEIHPYLRQMRSRMPFRFGKTVMTGMPVLHLRVILEDSNGARFEGWSACGLVSMWFDKDYSKSETRRENDLLYSVSAAIDGYLNAGGNTAWGLHCEVEPHVRQTLAADGLNGLTAGYGIALVDSAIIDGVCRHAGVSFFEGLKQGLLGLNPELVDRLPSVPSSSMAIRHTVGLGDPLLTADLTDVLDDGLPQSLEQVIDVYGVRYFKIKVNNNVDESLDRLERITSLLAEKAIDYKATLDGNEAFADMGEFRGFVERCKNSSSVQQLWERVLWFEQPVARQQALLPSVADDLKHVTKLKPVIIDESDDTDDVLQLAMAVGYSGISAKNCKGVFRTLHSFNAIHAGADARSFILSSEDLTNQPILPNHQDLCVAAALGITHSERNGHHFFRGFDFLPETERRAAVDLYPSLYKTGTDSIPSLRIEGGQISISDINASPGLGVSFSPDWNSMAPVTLPKNPPQD